MTCRFCGAALPSGMRADAAYCSPAHRNAAWCARRAARLRRVERAERAFPELLASV